MASSNTKLVLAAFIGATFMFCVVCGICVGIFFLRRNAARPSDPVSPRTPIAASHFDLTTRIQIESAPELEFGRGPFTFSFWFRTTATNRLLTFMAKRVSGMGDGWVMHSLDDHSLFFYAAGCATTKGPAPDSRDGQWHHVAGVRDGNQLRLYLDRQLAGTGGNACNFADHHPIRLGMDADSDKAWHFDGDMAEVHLYNRALTAGEVAEEWNNGQPLPRAVAGGGLVAGYHLGQGPEGTKDFSGKGNAGVLLKQ
ncbi:MAG TPA: LamG domain-containing protein [Verrucomicrobiae bacterium]|jgi:hypothetical protein